MNKQAIEKEALQLPETARAQLAEKLLASLNHTSESNIEQLWLDEARQRAAEIDNGKVKLVSAEDAADEINKLFE